MTAEVTSPGVIARDANHFRFAGRQPNSDMLTDTPQKLWDTAIPQAQKRIDDPIAWLAMQSARALAVEQDTLILAVPAEVEYLAACLTDNKNQPIFVDVLTSIVQRPMKMRVILGESLEDWLKIRKEEGLPDPPEQTIMPGAMGTHDSTYPPGGLGARHQTIPPGAMGARDQTIPPGTMGVHDQTIPPGAYNAREITNPPGGMGAREVSFPPVDENATRRMTRESLGHPEEKVEERKAASPWDPTLEKISRGLNQTPLRQYPQGRAHYFLNSIRLISETMDRLIEEAGGLRSEPFERGVSRAIDRLAQAVEFDPLLVALELERYREGHRKGIGDYADSIKHSTPE